MRLLTAGGLAALACAAAIAACSDQPSKGRAGPTEPDAPSRIRLAEGAQLSVRGAGSISVRGPGGIVTHPLPIWVTEGTVRGGVMRDESAASPLGVMAVTSVRRGDLPAAGGAHFADFTDDQGDRVTVAFLFAPDGGPLRGTRYYVNGELRMASDLRWTAAQGGWVLQAAKRRVYRGGQSVGEVRGTMAAGVTVASRSRGAELLGRLALNAARAFTANDANAQMLSGACRIEWLQYVAAQAALSAALVALAEAPSPVTVALAVAAAAKATEAEMKLWLCEENQNERGRPIGGHYGAGGDGPCDPAYWSQGCDDLPPDAL